MLTCKEKQKTLLYTDQIYARIMQMVQCPTRSFTHTHNSTAHYSAFRYRATSQGFFLTHQNKLQLHRTQPTSIEKIIAMNIDVTK